MLAAQTASPHHDEVYREGRMTPKRTPSKKVVKRVKRHIRNAGKALCYSLPHNSLCHLCHFSI